MQPISHYLKYCLVALLLVGLTGLYSCELDGGGSGGGGGLNFGKVGKRLASKGKNRGRRALRKVVRKWFRASSSNKLGDLQIKKEYIVVGFEPAWTLLEDNEPYNSHYYNLLSTLIVGGYDVNPLNGNARNIKHRDAALNEGIIKMAIEKNDELITLYSVSHYGDFGKDLLDQTKNYDKFLANVETQGNLLEQVNNMIDTLNCDGIFLDFQNIPQISISKYVEFVKLVQKKGVERLGEGYFIYLRLPSSEREQLFSEETIEELENIVDLFVLKAYDNDRKIEAGAYAPISSPEKVSLDSLVDYYTKAGLVRKHIVPEFPLMGTAWYNSTNPKEKATPYKTPLLPYREMIKKGPAAYPKDTSYSYFLDIEKNVTYYYDDKVSMHKKYAWVDSLHLAGVGLNALGYNKYRDKKMWQSLASVFAVPQVVMMPTIATYLLLFLLAGLLYSIIRYWQVRNFLNRRRSFLVYYIIGAIVILLGIVVFAYLLPRGLLKEMRIMVIVIIIFMIFPAGRKYFTSARRWM